MLPRHLWIKSENHLMLDGKQKLLIALVASLIKKFENLGFAVRVQLRREMIKKTFL